MNELTMYCIHKLKMLAIAQFFINLTINNFVCGYWYIYNMCVKRDTREYKHHSYNKRGASKSAMQSDFYQYVYTIHTSCRDYTDRFGRRFAWRDVEKNIAHSCHDAFALNPEGSPVATSDEKVHVAADRKNAAGRLRL